MNDTLNISLDHHRTALDEFIKNLDALEEAAHILEDNKGAIWAMMQVLSTRGVDPGDGLLNWIELEKEGPTMAEVLQKSESEARAYAFWATNFIRKNQHPNSTHYMIANRVLETLPNTESDDDSVRALAGAFCDHVPNVAKACLFEYETWIREVKAKLFKGSEAEPPESNAEYIEYDLMLPQGIFALCPPDDDEQSEEFKPSYDAIDVNVHDMLFAKYLRGLGEAGSELALRVETASTDRQKLEATGERWSLWVDLESSIYFGRWGDLLCVALWLDITQPRLEGIRNAKPALLRGTQKGPSSYARIDKATTALAWAIGTTGVEVAGDKYNLTPRFVCIETAAKLDYGSSANLSANVTLPVAIMRYELNEVTQKRIQKRCVLTPLEGDALVLLTALSMGQAQKMSLRKLTELLNPGCARIRARDVAHTLDVLQNLRSTYAVLEDNNGHLFETSIVEFYRLPHRPVDTDEVYWGYGHVFNELKMKKEFGRLNGDVLINLTGYLSIHASHSVAKRTYLYGARMWNDARAPSQNINALPWLCVEELLQATNSLSQSAIACLNGDPSKRRKLSRDRKRMTQAIELLADHKLVIVEQRGSRAKAQYQLNPPKEFEQAYRELRGKAKKIIHN